LEIGEHPLALPPHHDTLPNLSRQYGNRLRLADALGIFVFY
jgi:hypothetical protein